MPQCKLYPCKEQAVDGPWRKRYCAEHGAIYLAKQLDARKRHAALVDCAWCAGKVQAARTTEGQTICQSCQDEADEAAARQDESFRREQQWSHAETVHDLKEWFTEWHPELFEEVSDD